MEVFEKIKHVLDSVSADNEQEMNGKPGNNLSHNSLE